MLAERLRISGLHGVGRFKLVFKAICGFVSTMAMKPTPDILCRPSASTCDCSPLARSLKAAV
jgi:hypothetical protein